MQIRELKKLIEELDEELEIYIRYGEEQVSDIEVEFVPFDASWNVGEDCYLICSSGENIKDVVEE